LEFKQVFAIAVSVGLDFSFSFLVLSEIAGNACSKHKIQNADAVITFQ